MARDRGLRQGRISFCFVSILLLFTAVGLRLAVLMLPANAAVAAEENSSVTVSLGRLRGTIYDRRFLPITESESEYYVSAIPTEQAVIALIEGLPEKSLEAALAKLEEGKPAAAVSKVPIIGAGITSVKLSKRYSGIASHTIGYLGSDGRGVSGIEKDFDELLYYGLSAKIRYSVRADGSILPGVTPQIVIPETLNNGVVLTLDREIQKICEQAAEDISSGAVVVSDVKTGQIISMVSRPDYSQTDVAASLEASGAPLLNRALCAYNVGSIFKPLVAAAALESGVSEDLRFVCTGGVEVGGRRFACHKEEGHGEVGFSEAVSQSCNSFFYNLSGQFDMRSVLSACQKLGLANEIPLSLGLSAAAGSLPEAKNLSVPAACANLSIGQGDLMLTPVHIACIYNAIANDGVFAVPSLIKGAVIGGQFTEYANVHTTRVMRQDTAAKIRGYLAQTVEGGTGSAAKPEKVTAAGKTATAQTGWSGSSGAMNQAWFAGYFPAESPRYTVVVLMEDGSAGSVDCAPVFKKIVDGIVDAGR